MPQHAELIWVSHEDRIRRFWAGRVRGIASFTPEALRAPQAWADDARLARTREELATLKPDPRNVTLPSVFPDYGTISMPKYWGGRWRIADGTGFPFIEPAAATVGEALALEPRRPEDPALDGARALRLWRACRTGPHGGRLGFRTPDFQGVLNTAGLVVNQEALLVAFYEEPDLVHAWLQRVCDFLIALHAWLIRETGGRVYGNIWPYAVLPGDLGVSFTEDLMPLLSPEQWKTFGLPYVRQIERAFGPALIHCCGAWGRHVPALLESDLRLAAMEAHDPFTTIEEIAPLAWAKDMALIPYIALDRQSRFGSALEYYRWLWTTYPDIRFWFAFSGEPDDAAFAFLEAINGC